MKSKSQKPFRAIVLALVQFGGGIASMRGSIGGTTFSKNKGGSYARNKVTPVNPSTSRQTLVRALFGALSSAWKALTQDERQTWIDQAPNYPHNNIFGDPAPLTGQGLFNSLNGQLTQLALPTKLIAIPPLSLVEATFDAVLIDTLLNTISIAEVSAVGATDTVPVYATAPQSAGKNFVKTEYRLVGLIPAGTVFGPFDFTAGYIAAFGVSPDSISETSKVFVRVKTVSETNGQSSADFSSDGQIIVT